MPIGSGSHSLPEFTHWVNPLLGALRQLGGTARPQEVVDLVATLCKVSDEVLDQTLSGGVSRFNNQVHWARFYLAEGGFIDRSRRGVWKLTEKGQQDGDLSERELLELYAEVQARSKQPGIEKAPLPVEGKPTAGMASASATETVASEPPAPVDDQLNHADRLLALLKDLPPAGFERLCQRLLREAGFQQVTVTGKSGDGGIDGHGVLAINVFVSFQVLFQCKRYQGSVGPGQVRDFRGAMQGRADKGLILTTGTFSTEARREAARDGAPPIELVDGEKLVGLFEELELGLLPRKAFEVDDQFFDEYRT